MLKSISEALNMILKGVIKLIQIVFLNGDKKTFLFAKDVLSFVLDNCPRVTFSFIDNLTTWLNRQYACLPFVCESYGFYIIKE